MKQRIAQIASLLGPVFPLISPMAKDVIIHEMGAGRVCVTVIFPAKLAYIFPRYLG
jgi:hypothetical protein